MQCSVFIAMSLDGFIATRDGDIDWLSRVELPGEDYGYAAFAGSVDVLVMGRGTYDTALRFPSWPYAGKRVIVLTHREAERRDGVELYAGTPADLVARLRAEGAKRAYIDGGAVIRQFFAAQLIDDVTLSIVPVLLGDGIRLFGDSEVDLVLDESRSWSSGLVQLRYRVKRV